MCRQGVGGQFRVFEVAPSAVAKMGMRQLMGDHIIGKVFRAIRQSWLKDNTATTIFQAGTRDPYGAPLSWDMIVQCQTKARVVEEIGKDRLRQLLHHRYDTGRESARPYRSLNVLPKVLVVFGLAHVLVIVSEPIALPQDGVKSDPQSTNLDSSQNPAQRG